MKRPIPTPKPITLQLDPAAIAREITDFVDNLHSGFGEEHERKILAKITEILSKREVAGQTEAKAGV